MKARVPARQKLSKQMQASIQELVTKEREEQSKKLIEQILKVSLINLDKILKEELKIDMEGLNELAK